MKTDSACLRLFTIVIFHSMFIRIAMIKFHFFIPSSFSTASSWLSSWISNLLNSLWKAVSEGDFFFNWIYSLLMNGIELHRRRWIFFWIAFYNFECSFFIYILNIVGWKRSANKKFLQSFFFTVYIFISFFRLIFFIYFKIVEYVWKTWNITNNRKISKGRRYFYSESQWRVEENEKEKLFSQLHIQFPACSFSLFCIRTHKTHNFQVSFGL